MKKTFVTLATVAALVAAAAPAATTFANNPYTTPTATVTPKFAQLNKIVSDRAADRAAANADDVAAGHALVAAQANYDGVVQAENGKVAVAQQKLDGAIGAVDAAQTAWTTATRNALAGIDATDEVAIAAAQAAVDAVHVPIVAQKHEDRKQAEKDLADAKTAAAAAIGAAQNILTDAQAEKARTEKVLADAVARLQEALNNLSAVATTDLEKKQVEEAIKNQSAPAGNGAAASAGNGAAASAGNGKAAAKTVAAAKTATGAKTLPKTSAAK
ncbi:hypothetical protein HO928_08265 [Streptococcus suis]|nr:hypothetical protein [Streptococcus suis]